MPVLNIKDVWTSKVGAEVVPRKGNNEYAAEVVTEFIKRTGYKRIILKSDQENSIMALKDTANAMLPMVNITMELTPVGESSSNAVIESQIRRTTALTRVLKTCLEAKLKKQVSGDMNIVPWIVRHAGQIFIYFRRNDEGKTPWELEKGRPSIRPLQLSAKVYGSYSRRA
jgi:hypothetical protein